jgi:hypothetical protein
MQETNLHWIFHHLRSRLAGTFPLRHLIWFPDTGIASLIHLCGSHLRSIGVQAYSKCCHYHYAKDDRLWEQKKPPSNLFLLHRNFPRLMIWCSQRTQLCDAWWHLLPDGRNGGCERYRMMWQSPFPHDRIAFQSRVWMRESMLFYIEKMLFLHHVVCHLMHEAEIWHNVVYK